MIGEQGYRIIDTRRRFLNKAGMLSGVGSLLGVLPLSIRRAF